ncbi:abscisic acid receptor PYR1-like [Senna tora]|uniref:Abscisic acid receptor PYR1-like n=1 Tax=Senna tora TaxID=362788 RepID=A0A834WMV8_9FABA|nr:abscisic acid receptor PYR1-like [Senna tora]
MSLAFGKEIGRRPVFVCVRAMERGERSVGEQESQETRHHLSVPSGLTQEEFEELKRVVTEHHTYFVGAGQCSSLLAQRIKAAPDTVWSVVRRFDKPQTYKHFIKSCAVKEGFEMRVGCTRDVNVISGLPAATSTERLDILDEERHVTGFSIIGGEHRLRNYRSVTTVHGFEGDGKIWSVVLESYIVDVPEGNTEEDTRLFADTVVRLRLKSGSYFPKRMPITYAKWVGSHVAHHNSCIFTVRSQS